jgi:serine/threonine-protein kinase HipA
VVNTVVYIHKDKPALMLEGKKIWWAKDTLVKFGQKSCLLTLNEVKKYYQECFDALIWVIDEVEKYILKNPNFTIGKKMLDSWKLSIKEITTKELDNDTIRTWKNY